MYGTIERFNYKKGFGFIRDDQNQDYFFHYTDFDGAKNEIRTGKKVQFKNTVGEKGPCALEIQLLEKGAPKPVKKSSSPANAGGKGTGYLFTGIVIGIILGIAGMSAYHGLF